MDFGKKNEDGVNLYRINGSKDEIAKAVQDLKELGCEVWEPYELETSHKSWSVLLKVQIPDLDNDRIED
jgi:hypothetical protein